MTDSTSSALLLLLLLLTAARAGEGLLCYQSTCTEGVTSCMQDQRTELKECSFETFRQTIENLDSSPFASLAFANHSMMCITHGAEGIVSKTGRIQDIMLRMCFPDMAGVCDFLSRITNATFQGHGKVVKSGCHFCHTDGCNKPPTSLEEYNAASVHGTSLVLLLVICLALTW